MALRRPIRGAFIPLLAFCLLSTPVFAADDAPEIVRVIADGCASGTTPSSREAALQEAKANAVRLWIESTVGQPATDAFDPMMEYLDTYAASTRLTDVQVEENRTCVEAEIYLYERVLRTDSATVLLKTRRTPPVVAFLLIENDEAANARHFQEATGMAAPLAEVFRSKGLTVIEPSAARAYYGEREMLAVLESGPAALARFAADLNAEAVVCVESTLTSWAPGNGLGTVRTRAELKLLVVSASDEHLLERRTEAAETTAADAGTGMKFALEDALYKLRNPATVAAVLAARGRAPDQFELTIDGVRDLNSANQIGQGLRSLPGVSRVDVITVREGVARLRFAYSGKVGAAVEYLESGGAGPPMRAVQVVNREMRFKIGG